MNTSSSSSSLHSARRSVLGVPTRCWCGQKVIPLVSLTKDNPYRRFYRCPIALQRPTESHLFKWEDEAFIDEIKMVDAKCCNIIHDFRALSKTLTDELESHKALVISGAEELMEILHANSVKMVQEIDIRVAEATKALQEQQPFKLSTTHTSSSTTTASMHNIAVAVAVLGAMAYLYFNLT